MSEVVTLSSIVLDFALGVRYHDDEVSAGLKEASRQGWRLEGYPTLTTGGAAGTDRAIAGGFLEEKSQVIICDTQQGAGQAAVQGLGSKLPLAILISKIETPSRFW
jgi:hypothetical protein